MTKQETQDVLEGMVDANGLDEVIDMLSDVCGEKADHISTNWQEEGLAKDWRKASYYINAVLQYRTINAVSIGHGA